MHRAKQCPHPALGCRRQRPRQRPAGPPRPNQPRLARRPLPRRRPGKSNGPRRCPPVWRRLSRPTSRSFFCSVGRHPASTGSAAPGCPWSSELRHGRDHVLAGSPYRWHRLFWRRQWTVDELLHPDGGAANSHHRQPNAPTQRAPLADLAQASPVAVPVPPFLRHQGVGQGAWLPCMPAWDARCPWTISLTVPASYSVFATGKATTEVDHPDRETKTVTFQASAARVSAEAFRPIHLHAEPRSTQGRALANAAKASSERSPLQRPASRVFRWGRRRPALRCANAARRRSRNHGGSAVGRRTTEPRPPRRRVRGLCATGLCLLSGTAPAAATHPPPRALSRALPGRRRRPS